MSLVGAGCSMNFLGLSFLNCRNTRSLGMASFYANSELADFSLVIQCWGSLRLMISKYSCRTFSYSAAIIGSGATLSHSFKSRQICWAREPHWSSEICWRICSRVVSTHERLFLGDMQPPLLPLVVGSTAMRTWWTISIGRRCVFHKVTAAALNVGYCHLWYGTHQLYREVDPWGPRACIKRTRRTSFVLNKTH